jgi:hypothetical protein
VQCPNEKCDGQQAFFFQVQIRSADEPMTSFYKVCEGISTDLMDCMAHSGTVYEVCEAVEGMINAKEDITKLTVQRAKLRLSGG